ncbi:MAG: hypothetical protein HQK65_08300 [Desulfamplus sp.]|nr:hypothetical protein [Desulfamplus sp.]
MVSLFSQYDAQDLNRLAAKGILEKLRKIRQRINVKSTARRLLWELIQNAKDNVALCNLNNRDSIEIDIEVGPDLMRFAHNNGFFKNENIRGLIRRYSSTDKDRDSSNSEPPSSTGRFGTGFMTTHILSEEVIVKGVFQVNEKTFSNFTMPLDRKGILEKDIIDGIEKSFNSVEESIQNSKTFNIQSIEKFSTEFIYHLNKDTYEYAKIAIEELNNSVAYTLINLPQIKKIQVKNADQEYYYAIELKKEFKLEGRNISIFEISTNNHQSLIGHYATIKDDYTSIIVPIKLESEKILIEKPGKQVPRLFLDFPLIGTENLNLPFIINDPLFEPTEPRDGVSLTGGNDSDTKKNSAIIIKAFQLYSKFATYATHEEKWGNLFNLAEIKHPNKREWINQEWYEKTILNPFRKKLLQIPIVETSEEKRSSIHNNKGKALIAFPANLKPQIREEIWLLANDLFPGCFPKREHIHEWDKIKWDDFLDFGLKELSENIQRRKDIKSLSKELKKNEQDTIKWLNNYYDLLNSEGKFIEAILKDNYKVIPNQNGVFKKKSELFLDDDIEEDLKNILKILGEDIKEKLINRDVVIVASANIYEKTIQTFYPSKEQKEIVDLINELLSPSNKILNIDNKNEAVNYLISLFPKTANIPLHREKIYDLSKLLISDDLPEKKIIKNWDDNIWKLADRIRIKDLLQTVSVFNTVENLKNKINQINNTDVFAWLQAFIDFLSEVNAKKYIQKEDCFAILPNQNGEFKIEEDLFLDDGNIDEDLKDIAYDLGYNIRSILLAKEIHLNLPDYRIRNQIDLAKEITDRIKPALKNIDARDENKKAIRNLYLWMHNNKSSAQTLFETIYEKRFLLLSDDEISANIEKAEIFDEILELTGLNQKDIKNTIFDLIKKNEKQSEGKIKSALPIKDFHPEIYPEGTEKDIAISTNLLDFSSENSRISASDEAKQLIFEALKDKNFSVPENLDFKHTIVSGIKKPNGTPIKIVIKSGKAGNIYFNPYEWIALSEPETQLFVVTIGNNVKNITLSDLESINDTFHMRFNTKAFALETNLKHFAKFFKFLPYTHFIFKTPESAADYLEEFGLFTSNPTAETLTPDDKYLLQ